jgi:hypothetical protein
MACPTSALNVNLGVVRLANEVLLNARAAGENLPCNPFSGCVPPFGCVWGRMG